jgi:hypothetical protein
LTRSLGPWRVKLGFFAMSFEWKRWWAVARLVARWVVGERWVEGLGCGVLGV